LTSMKTNLDDFPNFPLFLFFQIMPSSDPKNASFELVPYPATNIRRNKSVELIGIISSFPNNGFLNETIVKLLHQVLIYVLKLP
jgi:hypothetical protein